MTTRSTTAEGGGASASSPGAESLGLSMTPDMEEVVERAENELSHPQVERRGGFCLIAAADLRALLTAHGKMVEALGWYGEQARLARLVHSEGDKGRYALASDGGAKARAALTGSREQEADNG